jgi:hypothetical protein
MTLDSIADRAQSMIPTDDVLVLAPPRDEGKGLRR